MCQHDKLDKFDKRDKLDRSLLARAWPKKVGFDETANVNLRLSICLQWQWQLPYLVQSAKVGDGFHATPVHVGAAAFMCALHPLVPEAPEQLRHA